MAPPRAERAQPTDLGEPVASCESILESVFASSGVGLCLVDPQGRVRQANETWLESVGLRAGDAIGELVWDLYRAPSAELRALHARVRSGEVVDVAERRTGSGPREARYEERLSPVPFPDGTGILITTWDITELEEARRREEWVARFPRENPDPVMRVARDSTVLFANAAAARFFGVLVGAPAPPALAEAARRAALAGERIKVEVALEGATFTASVVPVGDEVNLYAQDITARKAAEEALRAANERLRELDRRKDEFLAMLSHELRNPLAPIRNAIAILEQASPGGVQAVRAKGVIRRQVDHMARLVGDLLDVARIARGKIALQSAQVDLAALAGRAADDHRPLMYDREVSLAVEVPPGPTWVHGDATRLTQVVGNLLQNAAKFTERGGRVTVSVAEQGGFAELRVRDTGVGMAPELLARIFEPFVQADRSLARSQGGLGLGLALVKGITELHGGSVRAESAGTGLGSCFVVRLPTVQAEPAREARAPVEKPARARRVLVVDDNRDGAESLSEVLGLIGHEVEVAFDGPSAIEKACARPPDVVLCDLGLPGMSGYEVARRLRHLRPTGLRLIAVSGYAQPEDVAASRKAGFDAHVAKPPDPEELLRLLSP
jgi:PAS domain S-box-containing protein